MIFLILFLLIFPLSAIENYVLMGPPGSGKGTFSTKMIEEKGYKQICPGDILRTHIKNETELGQSIKLIVQNGDYIDDIIIYQIIEQEVRGYVERNIPFIIDGFPRHKDGYDFLIKLFKKLNIESTIVFIHFIIDDFTCIQRIANRLVCFNCYNVYNLRTKPPLKEMVCDKCENILEKRLGDTYENTKKRLAYFRNTIEPLINLAEKDYNVIRHYTNK